MDKEQPHTDHISQQGLNNNTNKHTNIGISKDKVVDNGYKKVGDFGEYHILLKDNKKWLKHKWKDEPIKEDK